MLSPDFCVQCSSSRADYAKKVGQVKEKISEEKGWEAGQQKLIYSGKLPSTDQQRVSPHPSQASG